MRNELHKHASSVLEFLLAKFHSKQTFKWSSNSVCVRYNSAHNKNRSQNYFIAVETSISIDISVSLFPGV